MAISNYYNVNTKRVLSTSQMSEYSGWSPSKLESIGFYPFLPLVPNHATHNRYKEKQTTNTTVRWDLTDSDLELIRNLTVGPYTYFQEQYNTWEKYAEYMSAQYGFEVLIYEYVFSGASAIYAPDFTTVPLTGIELEQRTHEAKEIVAAEVEKGLLKAAAWSSVAQRPEWDFYKTSLLNIANDSDYPYNYALQIASNSITTFIQPPDVASVLDKTFASGIKLEEFSGTYYGDPLSNNDSDYIQRFDSENAVADSEYVATTINYTNLPVNTNIQATGYFLANYTGTHTFYLSSDDFSYLWLGDDALSGWQISNALIDNGGLHPLTTVSATIDLEGGKYYPIRVLFGNQTGPGSFEMEYEHTGQPRTDDWTNKIYYNTSGSDGGF